MMFSDEQIGEAAADTLAAQEQAWDLAMTDPLWIRMYVANLREECRCLECSRNARRATT